MSEIQVNKISPSSGTTITLGDSGDTFTIPSGATITNSGTATGFGGDNTPAFKAYRSGTFSIPDSSATKIPFNDDSSTGFYDTDSKYDATTNYRFTPSVAGKYLVQAAVGLDSANNASSLECQIKINGTNALISGVVQDYYNNAVVCGVVVLGTTDYIECYGKVTTSNDANGSFNTGTGSLFTAHRVIT